VILNIDHIKPVSKGGTNEIINLVTSCFGCNNGKRAKKLSDTSTIQKQRKQLEELQQRREQLEMMMEWYNGIKDIDNGKLEMVAEYWANAVYPYYLNDNGKIGLKKMMKTYQIEDIIKAIDKATEKYLKYDNNELDKESVELAWKRVGGILFVNEKSKDDPDLAKAYYINGILKNKGFYVQTYRSLETIKNAYLNGMDIEKIKEIAIKSKNWTEFKNTIDSEVTRLIF
jgi:hypothetical protein